jgi:charged multivesicular body protein 4
LAGAEAAPIHSPSAAPASEYNAGEQAGRWATADKLTTLTATTPAQAIEEDEEEAELRELQAQLAM